MISVIILAFNSEASIERTVRSLVDISDDIHVVDSYSTDDTVAICERLGCKVVQHPFSNYSAQRNWSIDNLELKYHWQLHVDADEELEDDLVTRFRTLDLKSSPYDGYIIGRKIVFLGQLIRFGGIAKTWHCRLFKNGFGRCEDRLYDQHFVCTGKVGTINAFMLDHQEASLSEWTVRHNRWSDLESRELLSDGITAKVTTIKPVIFGDKMQRKRYQKNIYYGFPPLYRAFTYFIFRYIMLGGFLDGRAGLIYHVLQGFWFRFLVDAKIYEDRLPVRKN